MADALPSMVPKGERAKIGHWIALAFQMVRIYHTHVDCGVERSFSAVCSVKSMSSASGGKQGVWQVKASVKGLILEPSLKQNASRTRLWSRPR